MKWPVLIKQRRETLELTQTELAVKAGVSLPSIQNLESGRANPSLKTLESVFSVLGVEIEFRVKDVSEFTAPKEKETGVGQIVKELADELPGLTKGSAIQRANHLFKLLEKMTENRKKNQRQN